MDRIFLNGSIIGEGDAFLSINDRGFLYGDGIFETIRAYNSKAFRLEAHLKRMRRSAEALLIPYTYTDEELTSAVMQLLEINNLSSAYIRITLSRGIGPQGLGIRGEFKSTLLINAREPHPYPENLYRDGCSVTISSFRIDVNDPLKRHKTLNFLTGILAKDEAEKSGALEAVLLNSDGHVAEGSISNIFAVKDNMVITPPLSVNILPGITREAVIEICKKNSILCREEAFDTGFLLSCDEVFLTNSIMEVMPVSKIGVRENKGCGDMTAKISSLYKALI